jgi:hypothetical protein
MPSKKPTPRKRAPKKPNGRTPAGNLRVTQEIKDEFLALLAGENEDNRPYVPELAARMVGVPSRTLRYHKLKDEAFGEAWHEALRVRGKELFEQKLMDVALGFQRAGQAQILALFGILKSREPEVWREDRQQALALMAANGGPIEIKLAFEPPKPVEELAPVERKALPPGD